MIYPEFLKDNGTVGFVAPSFGCGIEPYKSAFESALEFWKSNGCYVNLGPNVYMNEGIGISNTPVACAEELVSSYVNSNIDAIISCGGGELMCETLSHIDFDAIMKSKPKWYMGYSDNTNFTFMLTTKCDIASLYGPNAAAFGMKPHHQSITEAYEILTGRAVNDGSVSVHNYDKYEIESLKSEENPLAPYNCTEDVCVRAYVYDANADCDGVVSTDADICTGGVMSTDVDICTDRVMLTDADICTDGVMLTDNISFDGRIIGGCMDCLVNLLGTRFDYVNQFVDKYADDGIIWYLEACDLNVFSIRRAMWQMNEAGWFRNVKGFIFGRPLNGEAMFNLNRFDAVLPIACAENKVPVIMDADIGHRPPQMVMINGALGNVKFDNGALTIDYIFE